ncbi:hypothetical protein OWM54_23585 [Myxococcus sp. MISCRS1]|uniref:hypothetical protein n=1 Tax=Myxococcus sp. MISCRS1 TaxID=2996786 RepID=UPI00226FC6E3|nr:hypothetical protein [Myxococcus sp. MISCRS1]MCY1000125.1 hypothetical protein [Myxococcus sp. MISCRS1]
MTSPRVDAVADDFLLLVEVLPEGLRTAVGALAPSEVLEVVLDLGRCRRRGWWTGWCGCARRRWGWRTCVR